MFSIPMGRSFNRKLLPKNHPLVKDIERYIAKRGVIRLLENLESALPTGFWMT